MALQVQEPEIKSLPPWTAMPWSLSVGGKGDILLWSSDKVDGTLQNLFFLKCHTTIGCWHFMAISWLNILTMLQRVRLPGNYLWILMNQAGGRTKNPAVIYDFNDSNMNIEYLFAPSNSSYTLCISIANESYV